MTKCDGEENYCIPYRNTDSKRFDKCHHEKFPKELIQDKFKDIPNIPLCCKGHGYMFKDKCEVRLETH